MKFINVLSFQDFATSFAELASFKVSLSIFSASLFGTHRLGCFVLVSSLQSGYTEPVGLGSRADHPNLRISLSPPFIIFLIIGHDDLHHFDL